MKRFPESWGRTTLTVNSSAAATGPAARQTLTQWLAEAKAAHTGPPT